MNMMSEKSCTACGLIKDFVNFDVDDKNLTGCTARCKECRGTLPIKSKRKYTRKLQEATNITHVEVEEDSSLTPAEELAEIKE